MTKFKQSLYIGMLLGAICFMVEVSAQNLPFSLYLEPKTVSGFNGVQSFAWGQADGKWLIVGGRTDGLHKAMGMGMSGTPFPASGNNSSLILINPLNSQVSSSSLSVLSVDLQEQLSSTNTQYFQEGDYLYVLGGYGYSAVAGKHITFPKIAALNVPQLVHAIENNSSIVPHIRQYTDEQFRVTGGQLEKIYDTYYLVGGQNFDGTYHHHMGMGMFTQQYTDQIRRFSLQDDGTNLVITHKASSTDAANLHRRDYNMVQQIMPNGAEGLTVFSGVFQVQADLPYLSCLNIDSSTYNLQPNFSQYYNHYQCANLPMYSAQTGEMYTVFFGGMAQYFDSGGVLTQDDNVPFVKTIAAVKREANGKMSEHKLQVELPELLGAGSELIPIENLAYFPNHVLMFDSLTQDTTLIGYIVGGIKSSSPNVFNTMMGGNNNSTATNQIFKVWLVKNGGASSVVNPQSEQTWALQVYPNPAQENLRVWFRVDKPEAVELVLMDMEGRQMLTKTLHCNEAGKHESSIPLKGLAQGSYLLRIRGEVSVATQKIVVH